LLISAEGITKDLEFNLCMQISSALQQCKNQTVLELVNEALKAGVLASDILVKGLTHGMNALGEKFRANEIFIPGVLAAAKIMNASLDILKPHLAEEEIKPLGYAVICTVKGDIHNIGKNIVKILLEGEGITCIDLGVNVPPEVVVGAVNEYGAQLVCLSALLTTTMPSMKDVVDAITKAGLRGSVRIMIGGAPVSQEFADAIGADCYTPDATTAAKEARRLLLEMNQAR